MAGETGTLERIAQELANALSSLEEIAQPANLLLLLNELGIDSPPDLSSDLQLTQGLNEVVTRAGELTSLIDQLLLAREEGDTLQIVAAGAALLEKCNAVRGALDTVGVRLQTL